MLSRLIRWWTSRIRIWGRETYVRLYPNPGFRITWGDPKKYKGRQELRWNVHYGFHYGSER